jgi:hypothetical protein
MFLSPATVIPLKSATRFSFSSSYPKCSLAARICLFDRNIIKAEGTEVGYWKGKESRETAVQT